MDYPEAPRFHIEEVDSARLDKFSGEEFESFYEQNVGARSGYEEFTCEAFLDGSRIGAIHGNYYWGGLNIHRLAVLPPFRSARVGTTLLRRICRKGASAGARLANLTTMDYQGPRYFPKFGFINNFILAPVADGHSIYYFTKPLPSSETDSDTDTGTSISIQTRGPAAAHHVITLRDSDAAPTSEQHAFFRSVFDQHNEECTGRDAGFKMFSFGAVDDDDGSLLGTAEGMQYWGMLHLTGLIVKQGVRKRGVGTALMEQVEKYARETGVCVMTVETFDFQAPDFYKKKGWTHAFETPGWKNGHIMHYFTKRLSGIDASYVPSSISSNPS